MAPPSLGFGNYYPGTSMIHQLDPRVKLVGATVLMTFIFMTTHLGVYVLIGISLYLVAHLSHVKFVCWQLIKSIWLILLFMLVVNMMLISGSPIFPNVEFLSVTREGFIQGMTFGFRLILTVLVSSLVTLTTSPFLLIRGLEALFLPFKKIGIPVAEVSFIIHLTFRFIPTFARERDKIMKAQAARGYAFDEEGVIQKAKSMVVVLIPLLMSSFRRVDELASAMETRLYLVGATRTSFKEMKLNQLDYKAMLGITLFVVGVVLLEVFIFL